MKTRRKLLRATPITTGRPDAAQPAPMVQGDGMAGLDQCTEHNGYRLRALASPTHCGLYAADLIIERPGYPSRHFHALDHFYEARQALRYATRWGIIWVDHQVKKLAAQTHRLDCRLRQA